jgi:hypothetical protein
MYANAANRRSDVSITDSHWISDVVYEDAKV